MAKSPRDGEPPRQINSREPLEAWLRAQKPGVAVAIAARTALRVAPLAEEAFPKNQDARAIGAFLDMIGAIFRATALAWVTAVYPTRAKALRGRDVTRDAARAATPAAHAVNAAAHAVNAAAPARPAGVPSFSNPAPVVNASACDAVNASVSAAATAAADIWSAVSFDVAFIESGASPNTLASQRLWPNGAPSWAEDAWKKLRSDLPAKDNWWVWTNWYHTVLSGETLSEEHSLIYVTVPESEWKKGPAAANAWIAARLKETGEMAPDPAFDSAAIEQLLTQDSHGATMEIVDGKARIASALHEDDASAAQDPQTIQLHQSARVRAAVARDRVQRLANQRGFETIAVTVDEFARLLSGDTLSVAANIGTVWELSTAIGTFTERDEEVKAGRGGMTPQMDADARETLDQLLMIAAPFVRRFPTARQNDEEVRLFKQTRESIEAPKRIFEQVSKENLIESQSQMIVVIATGAAERGEGVQAEKSRSWLNKTARNLLIAFMVAAGAAGPLPTKFGEKAAEEFYDHSQSREVIQNFLRETENDAFELFRDLPSDLGGALRELYRRLWQGRGPPPFAPTERV